MDALTRMRLIEKFPTMSERRQLKIVGRSSLRRITDPRRHKRQNVHLGLVKSHQDDETHVLELPPESILNTWADYLNQGARTYPSMVRTKRLRPGQDEVMLRTDDGTIIDEDIHDALKNQRIRRIYPAYKTKLRGRRDLEFDVVLSNRPFYRSRAGLMIFTHIPK